MKKITLKNGEKATVLSDKEIEELKRNVKIGFKGGKK